MDRMRIVLFGPPLSGKTEIARELARSRQAEIKAFQMNGVIPGINPRGPCVTFEEDLQPFEVVTFSGSVWSIDEWDALLEHAAGVLLVLDSQTERQDANAEYVEKLKRDFRYSWRGAVVFTKQDRNPKPPSALAGTPFENWPVFASRIDRPETLPVPVESILAECRS